MCERYNTTGYYKLNCICCDRILEAGPTDNPIVITPVYNGLIFRATGNFGSTVFDPMPTQTKEILQVVICDDCMKKKAKRVVRLYNIRREETAECGEFTP